MSYTIRRDKNIDAYIVTLTDDFDVVHDIAPMNEEAIALFENDNADKLIYIIDTLEFTLSIDKLLSGTKSGMASKHQASNHNKIKATIMVTNNPMLKASLDGFSKLGIGRDMRAATSLDHALLMAKQLLNS